MTMAISDTPSSPNNSAGIIALGIDVGGERKGFHAVALTDGRYTCQLSTKDVQELTRWCHELQARIIAVDAPCAWSKDGHSRPCERELMKQRIWCFSTPTRATALARKHQHTLGKATDHYGWMLRGEEIFRALEDAFPICIKLPVLGQKCCFETFPHAISWHLRGGNANATQKRKQRRALLKQAKIDLTTLTNIDLVDAALCALTAHQAATGKGCVPYGEPDTGMIIVPKLKEPLAHPIICGETQSLQQGNGGDA